MIGFTVAGMLPRQADSAADKQDGRWRVQADLVAVDQLRQEARVAQPGRALHAVQAGGRLHALLAKTLKTLNAHASAHGIPSVLLALSGVLDGILYHHAGDRSTALTRGS